jgi:NAD(P) transhydrogenase subunit alpha
VKDVDMVITTANIPGRAAPKLITEAMVREMRPGSVIVDLAAENGGNCELTRPGETVHAFDVTIIGALNLPATVPYHASQMFGRNVLALLQHLVSKEGSLVVDPSDEITGAMLVTHDGKALR